MNHDETTNSSADNAPKGLQGTILGKGIFAVGLILAIGGMGLSMFGGFIGLVFKGPYLGLAMIAGVVLMFLGAVVGSIEKRIRRRRTPGQSGQE